MYTGVTSVTSDQSNIGFILTNQRTKETRFYPCAGATETSAKSSAQSQVQQMRYSATFPLLLNIADQPTYFMALKGEDGLVKMYAMVNVQQYNIVETGQTVAAVRGELPPDAGEQRHHRPVRTQRCPAENQDALGDEGHHRGDPQRRHRGHQRLLPPL